MSILYAFVPPCHACQVRLPVPAAAAAAGDTVWARVPQQLAGSCHAAARSGCRRTSCCDCCRPLCCCRRGCVCTGGCSLSSSQYAVRSNAPDSGSGEDLLKHRTCIPYSIANAVLLWAMPCLHAGRSCGSLLCHKACVSYRDALSSAVKPLSASRLLLLLLRSPCRCCSKDAA
jgi:hypothetical protein